MLLPLSGLAQEAAPANPLSSDARTVWEMFRGVTLRAAEKMPEADYAFKPVPEVRSFGQLVGHVADAQYTFCSIAKGVARPDVHVEKTKTTKADLVAALQESNAFCDVAYTEMTDAKGVEKVQLMGRDFTRLTVLFANFAHDYEHYGNMSTYLRIKGLVPPSSEPRPAPKAK
jgi:uncharacterized damage-inducible protein DinB